MTDVTQQQPEKRREIRVNPEPGHPVRIDLMGNGFIEVTTAANVSKEGIGIKVPHGFKGYNLDGLAEILIKLPKPVEHSFSSTVRIIHQKDQNFGALFASIEKKDAIKLHHYIEGRLKQMDGRELLKMIE